MWANNGYRKKLSVDIKIRYSVSGYNHEVLVNKLKKNGITVMNARKKGKKELYLTINAKDCKKFFAITDELCYNVKKIKELGRAYPVLYLLRNVGVLIGAVAFVLTLYLSSDRIYSYSFVGTGSVYKNQVERILDEEGVSVYSKFSDVDLKSLASKIMQKSDKFSFVSCQKYGNRLRIELVLSKTPPSVTSGTDEALSTEYRGIIESIKVYRGTALVKVGDYVEAGDFIVSGYYVSGESVVKTGVIAVATVLSEKSVQVVLDDEGLETAAKVIAEEENAVGAVVSSTVVCERHSDGFAYTVNMTLRYVIRS